MLQERMAVHMVRTHFDIVMLAVGVVLEAGLLLGGLGGLGGTCCSLGAFCVRTSCGFSAAVDLRLRPMYFELTGARSSDWESD